ncbi:mandelate racemase/muconate lactonizing enzyme family protein [Ruania rhizosphaerae]|uniref:mandelate racemase/muconate lactonizing enzyme family protein n=1 Tax=Ruania rhizosphaerae TaxID=1840413 RepID=UPI00135BBD22|nr:mandelate racemase/muconate lactonizing enzyme family protein [Ruania rhizosphaerae]
MTTISRIDVGTAIVPLPVATGFSSRTVTQREYTLVRVTGDDGVTGIGFCYPGHTAASVATAAVRDLLGPVLLGQDAHLATGLWDRMYQESLLHGRTGSVMRALSALDIAIWDRNARAAGLPLHKYLGGHSDRVPAYASGGYYVEGKGPDGLAEEIRGYTALGFTAAKIKVGRHSPAEDADRLAAARDVLGPDGLLMLDANNAWRDVPTALQALRRWETYDPYWIEEPFGPDDIANHARLAERTPITVATGEIEAGRWRTKELIDAGGALILQQDAAVCGGITELTRIAHLADASGVTLAPHWFHDLHAPLVGAYSSARFVEYFAGDAVHNFSRLIDNQLRVDGGELLLHETPGLGFDFTDEALREYLVDGWHSLTREGALIA